MMPEMLTVLIVEDDPNDAELSHRVASMAFPQAAILLMTSGREVLAALTRTRPDLILLDLKLGDMQGQTLVEDVRTLTDCPIIITTGDVSLESANLAIQAGADSYLVKNNMDAQELQRTVTVATARRKLALESKLEHRDQLRCELDAAERSIAKIHENLNRVCRLISEQPHPVHE